MRASIVLTVALFFGFAMNASAALLSPTGVTVSGPTLGGVPGWVIDGFIPGEGQPWTNNTVYWNGIATSITIDLGQLYQIQDILVSVDNNDSYQILYSTNNATYTNLFAIQILDGEQGNGMDTFNTLLGNPEYVGGSVDFTPVVGRYVRIVATGGDNSYSVGELQVTGELAGVPEPASLAIWGGLGIAGLVAARRRKAKKSF